MKKDLKKTRSDVAPATAQSESNSKLKGSKPSATTILSNQLNTIPYEEREKFLEGLGRKKKGNKASKVKK